MFAPEGVGESTDVEGNHVAARTVFVCPVYGMEVLSKKARVGNTVEVYSTVLRTNLSVEEGECECGRVETISG